eukprot:GHVT01069688.1.p2 GENE.GHVT01069688.1~~GHVT01069688.1.p2  ORF type:complete len:169 (+),score=30.33 GHVT01069688.1:1402-1908(+)
MFAVTGISPRVPVGPRGRRGLGGTASCTAAVAEAAPPREGVFNRLWSSVTEKQGKEKKQQEAEKAALITRQRSLARQREDIHKEAMAKRQEMMRQNASNTNSQKVHKSKTPSSTTPHISRNNRGYSSHAAQAIDTHVENDVKQSDVRTHRKNAQSFPVIRRALAGPHI